MLISCNCTFSSILITGTIDEILDFSAYSSNSCLNFLKLSVNRKSPDEWINLETEYIAIMDETDENQDDIYRDCIYKLDCKLKEINKYLKLPLDINKFNYMIDNIIDFLNIEKSLFE